MEIFHALGMPGGRKSCAKNDWRIFENYTGEQKQYLIKEGLVL